MSLNVTALQTVTRQRKSTSCLLQYANNNRKQGRFNDVTIQSNDTRIPANQMVLSCYCSFFDQIFDSKTNNQIKDSIVHIPDVDGKFLELLIQYIYTGQICIDSDNVLDILATAHHLELDEVKEFCFEFLENCMTPDNCIIILITAKQYKNFEFRDKVYKYISDNYEIITKTPAFLKLDNEELFFIVFHLKMKFYVNNEVLCLSLLSWTKQDEKTRKQHFHNKLIKFVNVDQFSFWLIKDLLKESLIQENADYYKLLNERFIDKKSKETKIISIGGTKTKKKVKVVYSLTGKINESYPDLPILFKYYRAIKTNNFVYCIGQNYHENIIVSHDISSIALSLTLNLMSSFTSSRSLTSSFRLNLNEKVLNWEEIASINSRRNAFGFAVFGDTLVVCGGYIDSRRLSSAKSYNVTLNKWIKIEFLNQCRSGNESVTSDGCLYTMGGYDGENYLSSVERLDGLDQSWKSVSSMQTPRCWFASVSCNDVIYAIGGLNNNLLAVRTVEKYNCAADKWIYVSEMNIERSFHSACVMHGKIFVQ